MSEEIKAKGRRLLAISVDIFDEKSISDMVGSILKVFPRIDILVNTAGIAKEGKRHNVLLQRRWHVRLVSQQ